MIKNSYNDFKKRVKKFRKIIIWGLRNSHHTHRYIHKHFYDTLQKLDVPVIWVDDANENQKIVEKGDLILAANVAKESMPFKPKVYYCLHNFDESVYKQIEPSKNIKLQVYVKGIRKGVEKWNEVTFFDKKNRTLYQPWGTNLLPDEFKNPVFPTYSKMVFWIGSIWNNDLNQGNLREIEKLKKVLKKNRLIFIPLHGIPDLSNILLVRISRIAPAIAGQWQVQHDYLPCRMWKNISYGQIGISNVGKFQEIFKGCSVPGLNIEEIIENALKLNPLRAKDLIHHQQEITKDYTYMNSMINIMKAFERIN